MFKLKIISHLQKNKSSTIVNKKKNQPKILALRNFKNILIFQNSTQLTMMLEVMKKVKTQYAEFPQKILAMIVMVVLLLLVEMFNSGHLHQCSLTAEKTNKIKQ